MAKNANGVTGQEVTNFQEVFRQSNRFLDLSYENLLSQSREYASTKYENTNPNRTATNMSQNRVESRTLITYLVKDKMKICCTI